MIASVSHMAGGVNPVLPDISQMETTQHHPWVLGGDLSREGDDENTAALAEGVEMVVPRIPKKLVTLNPASSPSEAGAPSQLTGLSLLQHLPPRSRWDASDAARPPNPQAWLRQFAAPALRGTMAARARKGCS